LVYILIINISLENLWDLQRD